jgi:Vitamin K-dependent gamma-carboxylase
VRSGLIRLRDFWIGETDLAPVCLFRILFGLQLFNWVWQLFPNLNAFFTDEGIMPRQELLSTYADRFTLLGLVGAWWQVAIFWALGLAVAVLLTVGWRSRLMSFLAFIVVSSFSWRDPLILDGSDLVFRLVPLWLAFTECGARFSIDASARAARGETVRVRGPALPVRILEVQIAWIYLATGLEKMGGKLWPEGLASYYALQLEHTFGRSWARPLATNMSLVPIQTWGTLAAELAFLPLAMVPSRITRLVAVVLAAGLHLGILVLMNVGNFPVIMLSALVLFLPSEWIDRAVAIFSASARARLSPRALAFADGATREAVTALPAPVVLPRRDLIGRAGGFALTGFAALAFLTAVPTQLDALRPRAELGSLLRFLSVDQRWDMFAPEPARSDGWMRMPAVLADGTTLDLLTGGAADDSSERYSDPLYSRWAKVQERIASTAYSDYRLEYARQFCRTRNLHLRPGEVPLATFEVHYVERVIRPPGEGPPTFHDILLWAHHC